MTVCTNRKDGKHVWIEYDHTHTRYYRCLSCGETIIEKKTP